MSHPAKSFVHLTIRAAAHVNSTHSSSSNSSSSSLASSFSSNATDGKVTGFEAFAAAIFEMPFGVRWSNSLMIEQLVADIPLISIGILGLGVGTVWIGLARLNRPLLYILLSTLFSLFGGIIDLGNLLYSQGTSTIRLSSLSITTTLFLAGTTVFRLLYLYRRATQAAVLEKKIIIKTGLEQQSVMRRLSRWSFRPREGEVVLHSASWERFGITGSMIKFTMLAVVVAVGVLEALWRIGFLTDVNKFAVVNRASHGLQIAYLAIFTIKIVESTYTVDHKPRWENYRDAFPVLFGNVIGVANAVPNFPILGFSETPVGRFLSVVQTYIYLIDLVISDVRRPIRDSISFDPPHPPLLEKIESPKSEDAISVLSLPIPTTETVRSEQTIPVPGPPLRPPRPDEVRVGQDEMGWNGPVIRRSSNIPSWLGPPGGRVTTVDVGEKEEEDKEEGMGYGRDDRPFSGPVAPSPVSFNGSQRERPTEGSIILGGPPSMFFGGGPSNNVRPPPFAQQQEQLQPGQLNRAPSAGRYDGRGYRLSSPTVDQPFVLPPVPIPSAISQPPSQPQSQPRTPRTPGNRSPPAIPPPTAQLPQIPLMSSLSRNASSNESTSAENIKTDSDKSRASLPSIQSGVSLNSAFSLSNFPVPPVPGMGEEVEGKGRRESSLPSIYTSSMLPMPSTTSVFIDDETFLFGPIPAIPSNPRDSKTSVASSTGTAKGAAVNVTSFIGGGRGSIGPVLSSGGVGLRKSMHSKKPSDALSTLPEGSDLSDPTTPNPLTPTEIRQAQWVGRTGSNLTLPNSAPIPAPNPNPNPNPNPSSAPNSSYAPDRSSPTGRGPGLPSNPRPKRKASTDSESSQWTASANTTPLTTVDGHAIAQSGSNSSIYSYDPKRAFERPRPPPLQLIKEVSNERLPLAQDPVPAVGERKFRSRTVGKDQIVVLRPAA